MYVKEGKHVKDEMHVKEGKRVKDEMPIKEGGETPNTRKKFGLANVKTFIIYGLLLGGAIVMAFVGYLQNKSTTTSLKDDDTNVVAVNLVDDPNDSGEQSSDDSQSQKNDESDSVANDSNESGLDNSDSDIGEAIDVYADVDQRLVDIMKASTIVETDNPVVGIGTGLDYDSVTRDAVANAGGLENIISEGDTVLIKPNLIKLSKPGEGIITDYRVVQTLVDIATELGASQVIIAEASPPNGNLYNKYTKYDQIIGAELLDMNELNEEDCYLLMNEHSTTGQAINIPKIYMDADVVITAAKLKTHYEAIITLGLKNAFGVPPTTLVGTFSGKYTLHAWGGIPNSIVDLNLIRRPDFTIIDGIVGGEGNMPLSGTAVDSQVVIAGRDIVAVDTVGAAAMGFGIDEVEHLILAGETGLGVNDIEAIELVGASLEDIVIEYAPSLSY